MIFSTATSTCWPSLVVEVICSPTLSNKIICLWYGKYLVAIDSNEKPSNENYQHKIR